MPVNMWSFSQKATLPQRESVMRLRIVYRVAVASMSTKPTMPMPCPMRPEAAGNAFACL